MEISEDFIECSLKVTDKVDKVSNLQSYFQIIYQIFLTLCYPFLSFFIWFIICLIVGRRIRIRIRYLSSHFKGSTEKL